MPHPYLENLIEVFDGFTVEFLKKTANFRFMEKMRVVLQREYLFSNTVAFALVTRMKIELDNNLTDDEIDRIVTATFNAMRRVAIAFSASMDVSTDWAIKNLPMENFAVTLN